MISAYPLSWPEGFPRAKTREAGQFKTGLPGALSNVSGSIRLFGTDSGRPIAGLVMSSNVTLGAERPADPGVAVWFTWESMQVCIPVDRYTSVASNLQAIHHILEARRTEMRHGGLAIVRATFTGFKALPPPDPWWTILGVQQDADRELIEAAYRSMVKRHHPDAGGDTALFHRVQKAIQQAREARPCPPSACSPGRPRR